MRNPKVRVPKNHFRISAIKLIISTVVRARSVNFGEQSVGDHAALQPRRERTALVSLKRKLEFYIIFKIKILFQDSYRWVEKLPDFDFYSICIIVLIHF